MQLESVSSSCCLSLGRRDHVKLSEGFSGSVNILLFGDFSSLLKEEAGWWTSSSYGSEVLHRFHNICLAFHIPALPGAGMICCWQRFICPHLDVWVGSWLCSQRRSRLRWSSSKPSWGWDVLSANSLSNSTHEPVYGYEYYWDKIRQIQGCFKFRILLSLDKSHIPFPCLKNCCESFIPLRHSEL